MPVTKGKKPEYSIEDMQSAVRKVLSKEMGFNEASRIYKIPRGTLYNKVHMKTALDRNSPGRESFLSSREEHVLCEWIKGMSFIGYGKTKADIPQIVKEILDKAGVESKFKDNLPTSGWTTKFLLRHKELSPRIPEALGHLRSNISKRDMQIWFENFESYLLDTHNIIAKDFLVQRNGLRIWNADETGFPLQGSSSRLQVLSKKGSKNVYRKTSEGRTSLTVLGCASANGLYMKPLIIYPYKKLRVDLKGVDPSFADFAKSDNGWINSQVFFEWLANKFYKYLCQIDVEFSVILLLDGHKTHISFGTAAFCKEKKIIIYCFRSHASHIQQPLDISVYGPMKSNWNRELRTWILENPSERMNKGNFLPLFKKVWEMSTLPENAVSGFEAAGLVPFDVNRPLNSSKFSCSLDSQKQVQESYINVLNQASFPETQAKDKIQECERILEDVCSEYLDDFQNKFANGIPWEENDRQIPESSLKTKLFRIYKAIKELSPMQNPSLNRAEMSPKNYSNLPSTSDSCNQSVEPSSSKSLESSSGTENIEIAFESYVNSPFKHYLKLPSIGKQTQKKFVRKLDIPEVLSGEDMIKFHQERENCKRQLEKDKEEPKKEREQRKRMKEESKLKMKGKGKGKLLRKEFHSDSESDESCMDFESDSSEEILEEEDMLSRCKMCKKKDGSNAEWIGCDICGQWFHIMCLGLATATKYYHLSEEELQKEEFICVECQKIVS